MCSGVIAKAGAAAAKVGQATGINKDLAIGIAGSGGMGALDAAVIANTADTRTAQERRNAEWGTRHLVPTPPQPFRSSDYLKIPDNPREKKEMEALLKEADALLAEEEAKRKRAAKKDQANLRIPTN